MLPEPGSPAFLVRQTAYYHTKQPIQSTPQSTASFLRSSKASRVHDHRYQKNPLAQLRQMETVVARMTHTVKKNQQRTIQQIRYLQNRQIYEQGRQQNNQMRQSCAHSKQFKQKLRMQPLNNESIGTDEIQSTELVNFEVNENFEFFKTNNSNRGRNSNKSTRNTITNELTKQILERQSQNQQCLKHTNEEHKKVNKNRHQSTRTSKPKPKSSSLTKQTLKTHSNSCSKQLTDSKHPPIKQRCSSSLSAHLSHDYSHDPKRIYESILSMYTTSKLLAMQKTK